MAKSKGWRPLAPEEEQEIVTRYAAGELLTALSEEYRRGKDTLRKLLTEAGVTLRPRGYPKGTVWHPEWREAHKQATQTPEFAEKSRKATLKALSFNRESPATNTAIEQRMHDALKKAGIGFTTQSLLLDRYLVDIEIHQAPIVIEADGSTAHAADPESQGRRTRHGAHRRRLPGLPVHRQQDKRRRRRMCQARYRRLRTGLPTRNRSTRSARVRGPLHPLWKGGEREFTCEQLRHPFMAQPCTPQGTADLLRSHSVPDWPSAASR